MTLLGVAALLLACLAASPAEATHPEVSLPGSNFEIDTDANLKQDDPSPSLDWATLPTGTQPGQEIRGVDKPTGQTDDSYQGGTKEDTVCPGEVTGSIPNNKSDLLTFHGVTQEADPGFFNFAWSRVSDPSGTTLMDFEFNQSSTKCASGPNIIRSTGDLLVEYAIDQGGSRAEISAREWTGSVWGPVVDLDDSTACGGGPCATGSINTTTIPAAESDGLGLKQPRTFGEAQLDLRFLQNEGECLSFGAMMVKSRSSDAFNSQLKDFILPQEVNLTNCGSVIIRKQTLPDEDPNTTSFDYTSDILTDPVTPTGFSLTDDGSETFNNVVQGSYFVNEEAPPAGWTFVGVDCSASSGVTVDTSAGPHIEFTIDDPDDVVDCTYTNQAQADLHIVKVAERDGVDFTFNADAPLDPATFTLQDGDQRDYLDLAPGTYGVNEVVPANWDLQSATCDNGDDPDEVTLGAGDDVTCTFTNVIERGALLIHKDRKHAADGPGDHPHSGVTFTVTNGAFSQQVVTGSGGNACIPNLPVSGLDGDYTVTESLPAGYHNADLVKDYTVVSGTTCATAAAVNFLNTPLTNISVSVDSQVPGGTNSTVECVPPASPPGQFDLTTPLASGDGTLNQNNLEPGTYTCTIVIDP